MKIASKSVIFVKKSIGQANISNRNLGEVSCSTELHGNCNNKK